MSKEIYGVIYRIKNLKNNKIYIGQTVSKRGFKGRYYRSGKNLIDRVKNTYESEIRRGKHVNVHIHNSIKKYGIYCWEVIEVFDVAYSEEELNYKEWFYIEYYNCKNSNYGYNKRDGGDSNKCTQETRDKIKENHADISRENNPMFGKGNKVAMIDKSTNNVIKIFDNSQRANEYIDELTGIKMDCASAIRHCAFNKHGTSRGYKWRRVDEYGNILFGENDDIIIEFRIAQIDKNTNDIIKIFDCLADANEEMTGNRKGSNISSCLKCKSKTAFGYKWNYIDNNGNIILKKYPKKEKKKENRIAMLDKDTFEVIKIFDTKEDIREYLNIKSNSQINNCLTGKSLIGYGYKWRFIDDDNNIIYNKLDYKTTEKIAMIDKNTNEILKIFNTQYEADSYLGYECTGSISKCLNGDSKTSHGYKWKIVKVDIFNNIVD